MLTDAALVVLHERFAGLAAGIPGPALLFRVAGDFILMVQSYEEDGHHFMREGDRVNALASAAYALGWLDAGVSLGLLEGGECRGPDIFLPSQVTEPFREQMEEKTLRYDRLLDSAIQGVMPAPEPGTFPREIASRFLVTAGVNLSYGRLFYREQARQNALFCFSYGFSWLDAGIRAGLFRITGNPELFAH